MTFIALDIGNSRTKYGFFPEETPLDLPLPLSSGVDDSDSFEHLRRWLASSTDDNCSTWHIATTNERRRKSFDEWLAVHRPKEKIIDITNDKIPISMNVDVPDKVGIDRLLAAFGAIRLRYHRRLFGKEMNAPFLIVDAGTAITIDLISSDSEFLGGAILPGFESMASALSEISSRLPKLQLQEISSATFPGKNTTSALATGIMGSVIGAIRQFHSDVCSNYIDPKQPHGVPIYLTGGNAELIESHLRQIFEPKLLLHVPNLVLSSIATVACR